MQSDKNLVWIDMEMTGLDPDVDRVLEIATIITNDRLEIVAEGPVIAVHQSDEILNNMSDWCKEHHGASGLTARVQASRVTEAQAELETLEFIKLYVPEKTSPLCGNSIGQDRRFLYRYMPTLQNYFHYRSLDVSSIKILCNLWKPEIMGNFKKKEAHLALDDIRESIAELRFYRENFFKL